MEKFKQKLKTNVADKTAAFSIAVAITITWIIVFSLVQFVSYTNYVKANALSTSNNATNMTEEELNELIEIAKEESEIDEEEAIKENEEEYEKLKEENKVDESAADKYYIKVNYGAQVVTVYTKDSNGEYTVPVRAMLCSTGTYTPTSGVYRTLGKGKWWKLIGDVYGQYSTWITGDILFHSVPYLTKGDKSSLEYWEYDKLGQRVSMGCVRLTVEDALWIYNNCVIGTQVEFYASSDPGPLGKPTTRKISDAPSNIRGWDPTDPDENNPWPEYLKELAKQEEEKKKQEEEKEDTTENTKPESSDDKKPTDNTDKNNGNTTNTTTENTTVENDVIDNPSEPENDVTSGGSEGGNEIENEISNEIDVNEIETNII